MLAFYRILFLLLFPVLIIIIYLRSFLEKEDKNRFKEKLFIKNFNFLTKKQKLIWFHVASIGELQSIIPLVKKIESEYTNIEILITTTTLSSAKLLEKEIFSKKIYHRFLPLDINFLTKSFLNGWRPDLVCFVDSEIWPNFIFNIKEKKIPLILLNARITKKTLNRWNKIPGFAKKIFNKFDEFLVSSQESQNNLKLLQVKNIHYIGNLKFTYEVDKTNNIDTDINNNSLKNYNVWCAASTHLGEEEIIIKTHLLLEKKIKLLKTIIVPRHIFRCNDIKNICEKYNLKYQILNENDQVNFNASIMIVNSYGTLQKYYRLCRIVFVGKSLISKLKNVGGQNPIEPAKYGCKIFHGPYIYNFKEIYKQLSDYNISQQIHDEHELAEKLENSFLLPDDNNKQSINSLNKYGYKILEETFKKISNYIA